MRTTAIFLFIMLIQSAGLAQRQVKGKIIDAITHEPITAASVHCSSQSCSCGCSSNNSGDFDVTTMKNCCSYLTISCVGYLPVTVSVNISDSVIGLQQDNAIMQSVTLTANREAVKRSLAPVAVNIISSATIRDTKPATIDQVLNKVSGVYMVNLGNEQHSMSIRQPMTTKSLFLYLEDGIPLRTTGLFNHNALLEINMAAVKNIEVIKGPSSSLYGSEAIGGVVNFITSAPAAIPVMKLSLQAGNLGYKRTDLQTSFSKGKWGFGLNGYYADKKNSFMEFTNFHKSAVTARIDYHFTDATTLINTLSYINYYSDMTGGIDSARFADKSFGSNYTFNYRKVKATRYRSSLTHTWNERSKSTASFIYRSNSVGQNPAYSIRDDYRRSPDGLWVGQKNLAHGEINEVRFNSYALILQHRQKFAWKDAVLISGASIDISPSAYSASYIRINKDSVSKIYSSYESKDSLLAAYQNDITNYAAYTNFEFSPLKNLRMVASIRYDLFHYNFANHLPTSSYSGSPDTVNNFSALSPKIGLTYTVSKNCGFYINYSEGFVPPQVTDLYKGVKVPYLRPSVFINYEAGGWVELIKKTLSADLSIYRLNGKNEIIAVKMDDGTTQNRNAGKTSHKGIELGINYSPLKTITIRFSGAYSQHRFEQFIEKGTSYTGNEMNGAPHWLHNTEIGYKPGFLPSLRVSLEWQKVGTYYMDPQNLFSYKGYNVFHFRAGYKIKACEIWATLMNITGSYYAYTSSKTASGYSYTPAEPRNIVLGLSYDFGHLLK